MYYSGLFNASACTAEQTRKFSQTKYVNINTVISIHNIYGLNRGLASRHSPF
jgi:hypothetical protein